MSKINVEEIAKSIFAELEQQYKSDVLKLAVEEVKKHESSEMQNVALINGLATALQNHAERFTVRLVQEVVDRIQE